MDKAVKESKVLENVPSPKVEEGKVTGGLRKNPWIISTFIFVITTLILLIPFLGITGNAVSDKKAGESLVSYLNTIADSNVTLVSVEEKSGMYLVTVEYKGQDIPLYVTKDGKSYTSNLIPLIEEEAPLPDVPKTDKPVVELYVFTYCPYGLQMEKAFYSVVDLFKDKADIKIRQIGAMHGEYEKIEAERQLCIGKNYPTRLWAYVNAFATDSNIGMCNGDATCVAPLINSIYTRLGINANTINTCMTSEGEALYNAEVENAGKNGVSGSPTVLINGVSSSLSRSPDAIKAAICNAFSTAPTTECAKTLSADQASAGFGASAGSASASTATC